FTLPSTAPPPATLYTLSLHDALPILNAQLPAKIILIVIGVFVAVAFFAATVLKDLRIPALAVVLMLVSGIVIGGAWPILMERFSDRKSTRLNSSHVSISYAVFCLKKK